MSLMCQTQLYFLGVDGGGSGCRARVVDAGGAVLGRGDAGPATLRLGADASWAAVMSAANDALADANVQEVAAVHVAVGLAGITRADERAAWLAKSHPFASLSLVGDEVAACLGAHSGGDGGIVIVGTGSNAFGMVGGGEVRIGGHGFPVSDEGSGAMIGLDAMRLAARAYDGRIETTPLLAALLDRFGNDIARVVAWVDAADAAGYAALAPLVVAHAERRDAAAVALMERAAADIAALAEALVARGVVRVALVGGLAASVQLWMPAASRVPLVQAMGDAIDGAIIVARRAAVRA